MHYRTNAQRCFLQLAIILLPAGSFAQGIYNKGANLILNGSVQLVLNNASFVNEGFLTAGNSTVRFTGEEAVHIGGNTTIPFHHVIIKKSSGAPVQLRQDITINGTITMNSGNLLLFNQTLFLGSTGNIAGESNQSHITGNKDSRIFLSRKVTTPLNAFNPGNIGVELTSAEAPGLIVIERRHAQETVANGIQSIQRSFTITAERNRLTGATLRFFYLNADLAGIDETGLALWTNSDISNGWTLLGSFGNDTVNNWVVYEGIDRWGRFTVAEAGGLMMTNNNSMKAPSLAGSLAGVKVQVYPNPVRNTFKLELLSNQEKKAVISLYDQAGHLLQQKKIHFRTGINSILWDLGNYAAGMYYLVFENRDQNIKIIKE